MKLILILLFLPGLAKAACSSITRTNATANQVLTSTKYNADLNVVYNFVNDLDGGCIDAGSVEAAALNSTEFAPVVKGTVNGCEVTYSSSNVVGIGKCQIAVNGYLLDSTSNTTQTWGCSGCSSEATGSFYVYVKNQSTFATYFSTTAPDKVGYSGNDRVIGAFYNNSALNIDQNSVFTWDGSKFSPPIANVLNSPGTFTLALAEVGAGGTVSNENQDFINGNCSNAATQVCTFNTNFWNAAPFCFMTGNANATTMFCQNSGTTSTSSTSIDCRDDTGGQVANSQSKNLICIGQRKGI